MLIFVAVPYSDKDTEVVLNRYSILNGYLVKLFNERHHPIAPVAIGHPIVSYGIPGDYAFWQEYSRKILSVCEEVHVLCMPGWIDSSGVQDELKTARAFKKLIRYINWQNYNELFTQQI